VFGGWQRGRYSEAIFGSHAGKFPKTAEHSPPLKKGGQGGFLFSTSPPSPPLLDKSSPSPRFLWSDEIPPAPFAKGGDIRGFARGGGVRGFAKGGGVRGLVKGEIF
jgi:hypothetical protein